MKTFYHYTIADRLVKILISRYLKLTPADPEPNEPQLVWLTTNPEWDRTAFYGYPDEVLDNAGRIRITLKGDFPHYREYRHLIPNIEGFELSGLQVGCDINDWHVSADVVDITQFQKIELWRNNKWEEVPCLN